MRPYPLFHPESTHFSITAQNGFVEDQILLLTRAALYPLRRHPNILNEDLLSTLQEGFSAFAEEYFWP